MVDKIWGIAVLVLGACQSSSATVAPEPYAVKAAFEVATQGTAHQLEAVAELRRTVDGAARMGRALERTRTPYTGWLADGTMCLITGDLERRRHVLRASESRLVQVSLIADVDPALQRLMREFPRE